MNKLLPWQEPQWHQLQRAIENGRVPHALLLTGTDGIGKSLFARLLANALVCDDPGEAGLPCGSCKGCHLFHEDSNPDIHLIEPEEQGKQIKIETIRDLVSKSVLSVTDSKYRVFIIDPADAMNAASTNALLKTLEEPVSGTLLLLVSSFPDRLPATIKSRCQVVRFQLPQSSDALQWLSEQIELDPGEVDLLLQAAGGAPLKALEMYHQERLQPYLQALDDFLSLVSGSKDPVQIAAIWHKAENSGSYLDYMAAWMHDLIRLKSGDIEPRIIPLARFRHLKSAINRLNLKQLYATLDFIYEIKARLVNNLNMQLALERVLLYWTQVNRNGVK